jgi:hypothetical protein
MSNTGAARTSATQEATTVNSIVTTSRLITNTLKSINNPRPALNASSVLYSHDYALELKSIKNDEVLSKNKQLSSGTQTPSQVITTPQLHMEYTLSSTSTALTTAANSGIWIDSIC